MSTTSPGTLLTIAACAWALGGCGRGVTVVSGDREGAADTSDAADAATSRDASRGAPDVGALDAASTLDAASDAGGDAAGDAAQAAAPDAGAAQDAAPDAPAPTGPRDELDPNAGITWLHPDISGWPITSALNVRFSGNQICLEYDKKDVWPEATVFETAVVANAWVFARDAGRWHAGTFEWMRPGQECKSRDAVEGGHIKIRPFDAASGWRPSSGEELYFMVSGLIRMPNARNVSERTNVVRVIWP